ALRNLFAGFTGFVRNNLARKVEYSELDNEHLRFLREVVEAQDAYNTVRFEDTNVRARGSRVRVLNQNLMAASTTYQRLNRFLARLHRSHRTQAHAALLQLFVGVSNRLSCLDEKTLPLDQARDLSIYLASVHEPLRE